MVQCRSWADERLATLVREFAAEDPERIAPTVSETGPIAPPHQVLLLTRGDEAVGYVYGKTVHAASAWDGPRLHHLYLIRELRGQGRGLGAKMVTQWCSRFRARHTAFSVLSPNGSMKEVLRKLGAKLLHHMQEADNCAQTTEFYLLERQQEDGA